jgi:mannose/fructose/N-acetylgalactosamine-specific phosphotransferase system component IIB
MRFYQSLKGPLKIYQEGSVYVIGIKHTSQMGTVVHNCVHTDDYIFVVFASLELAKEAAKKLNEIRTIPIGKRIEVG